MDPADPARRASDAERDRVAAVLSEAVATGMLTSEEHADRLEAAYSAKTIGQLAPLTRDLPTIHPRSPALPAAESQRVTSTFSKTQRGGRWMVARHTTVSAAFGALLVDLTEAIFPGKEIELTVEARCAKLFVRVPRTARIIDEGRAFFAKRLVTGGAGEPERAPGEAEGPVIRVTGGALFSKVIVAREGGGDWQFNHQFR